MKAAFIFFSFLFLSSCQQQMAQQPKYKPYDSSYFFADQMASRPLPSGTIPRSHLKRREDQALPFPLTLNSLQRGRQRYTIYCSPCHGAIGDGHGIIVMRGFKSPPSFHTQELQNKPLKHFFEVITHGRGAMYSYASRVNSDDRWAIAAYIRALQLSQNVPSAELSAQDLIELEKSKK